jgi:hypothetical protein
MVEAMMALAILGLGATGVAGIQKATIVGNNNARNLAAANAVASTWAERLRTDALEWNSATDLGDTSWLSLATQTTGNWFVPTVVPNVGSPASDVTGADIFPNDGVTQAFCTHLRLTRLYPNMIRAEIRVFWNRRNEPVTCAETPAQVDASFGRYGFVYLTTGIYQNTAVN